MCITNISISKNNYRQMENQKKQDRLQKLYSELSTIDKEIYSVSKRGNFAVVKILLAEKARIYKLIEREESPKLNLIEKSKLSYLQLKNWLSLWRDLVSKPELKQQKESINDQSVRNSESYLREYSSLLFGEYRTISQVYKPYYQSKVDKAAAIVRSGRE